MMSAAVILFRFPLVIIFGYYCLQSILLCYILSVFLNVVLSYLFEVSLPVTYFVETFIFMYIFVKYYLLFIKSIT
jgi:hypothetical protein